MFSLGREISILDSRSCFIFVTWTEALIERRAATLSLVLMRGTRLGSRFCRALSFGREVLCWTRDLCISVACTGGVRIFYLSLSLAWTEVLLDFGLEILLPSGLDVGSAASIFLLVARRSYIDTLRGQR